MCVQYERNPRMGFGDMLRKRKWGEAILPPDFVRRGGVVDSIVHLPNVENMIFKFQFYADYDFGSFLQ